MKQEVDQIDQGDPEDQCHGGERSDEGPADQRHAIAGSLIAVDDERQVAGARQYVDHDQGQAQVEVGTEQPGAAVDEARHRKLRRLFYAFVGNRLALDGTGCVVGVEQHRHRAALHQEHEDRAANQDQTESRHEREQRDRLRGEGVGDGGEHLTHAALQEVPEVAAEQHRDEDGGANDRHGQQHLERRLGHELNRDGLPVGDGQQGPALEQQLQVQIDFAIAPVYSGDSS